MPSIFDRIYKISPVWVQNLGMSAYGLLWKRRRFGGVFKQERAGFAARESYSIGDWETCQLTRLREMVLNAYHHVPYYREQFENRGLKPDQLANFRMQDLVDLPLLEKNDLRLQPEAFISSRTDARRLHTYHTSGTTGSPVAVRMSAETQQKWAAAYETRVRNWAGYITGCEG